MGLKQGEAEVKSIEQIWIYLEIKPSGFADRLDINVRERSQG